MLPLVFLLAAAVAGVGIAATQHVAVQGLAGAAARTAAIDDDAAVQATVAEGTRGATEATVAIAPSDRRRGDLVTVTVSQRHRLFGWPAVAYTVTAVAVARTELP